MTAKCQTKNRIAKVCQVQVFLFTFNKMTPNSPFLFFSWRIGLIDPNRAIMESDNLHAAKKKVKVIKDISLLEHHCLHFLFCQGSYSDI